MQAQNDVSNDERLTLSGQAYTEHADLARDPVVFLGATTQLQPGDIKLLPHEDFAGSAARRGRHPNFGYSGNIHASVWNGLAWGRLSLHRLVDYNTVHYDKKEDRANTAQRVGSAVRLLRGRTIEQRVPPGKKQAVWLAQDERALPVARS